MADYLTPLDVGFLHLEDTDPHTNLGMGGLAILDGPVPDYDALLSTLGERIAACPRFAQRLRRRFLDLGAPEWIDDADFRLTHHVRRVAVPAPGTDADLHALVADVMSWRLDRNRPLWEIWVIDGLSDGRWAMLMKVHPCVADAIATVHILTGLSDAGVHGAGHHRGTAELHQVPPPVEGWRAALRGAAALAGATLDGARWAEQTLRGTVEVAAGLLRPESPLTGPVAGRRRYTTARVDLADVQRICRTFDVTVNDVALAALAESYRTMLIRRGGQPRPDSLRTLVPTRSTVLMPRLPVDEENPVLRLRMVHARLTQAKAAGDQGPLGVLGAVARTVPFPVTAWAANLLSRLPQRSVMTLAVDVPGPGQALQIMGRNVTQVLPIPPIAMQLRTGTAVLSYADSLYFGILTDFSAVPDADELARGVEAAVARLRTCSVRRRKARDRHGLSLVVNS
ncbi:wax ester/triacylglycerol synthase family O-acyltransferase [Mycobacterium sp. M1]|uniref:Diacylglycerol O-acyltransferase n=1 Tax=Mycolicibacter acidiphilus TaxID=2835306 RepID=A0ABS5RDE1_9MYCO|nr:wax ester/triacylglycerol synthase family O-acyltransferase [Mycolicibacter acidiphilus]MBS9531972.1 wax ester/triacylglycerol synthase family O-acyltransferase [Mycolicibacter acidiphilus]